MFAPLASLVPILVALVLGYALRRSLLPDPGFWAGLERLTYFVLFPVLLVHGIAGADLVLSEASLLAAACVASLTGAGLLALLLGLRLRLDGPAVSSAIQGAARFNTYVVLGAAGTLFGPPGLALASLTTGVMIIVVNILSVAMLVRFGQPPAGAPNRGLATVLLSLARNPLIIACAVGLALNLGGVTLPGPLAASLGLIGAAAVTIGILVVGAALELRALHQRPGIDLAISGLKLIGQPVLFLGLALLLKLPPLAVMVGLICCAAPSSPAAYMLARQMGGDAAMMARLITLTTLLAGATLPAWLVLATAVGLAPRVGILG